LRGIQLRIVWLVLAFVSSNKIAVLKKVAMKMMVMIAETSSDSVWYPILFMRKMQSSLIMMFTTVINTVTDSEIARPPLSCLM
jgi:hypothetical protein